MHSFSNTPNRFYNWFFAPIREAPGPGPPAYHRGGVGEPLGGQGVAPPPHPKKSKPRICVYILCRAKWSAFCEKFLIKVEILFAGYATSHPPTSFLLRVWPCPCMWRLSDFLKYQSNVPNLFSSFISHRFQYCSLSVIFETASHQIWSADCEPLHSAPERMIYCDHLARSRTGIWSPLFWARQERGWGYRCRRSSPNNLVCWPTSVVALRAEGGAWLMLLLGPLDSGLWLFPGICYLYKARMRRKPSLATCRIDHLWGYNGLLNFPSP